MRYIKIIIKCLPLFIVAACGETKTIFKGNNIYQYVNNQDTPGKHDQVNEYTVTRKYKSKIKDKTDYYQISTAASRNLTKTDSADIDERRLEVFQD